MSGHIEFVCAHATASRIRNELRHVAEKGRFEDQSAGRRWR